VLYQATPLSQASTVMCSSWVWIDSRCFFVSDEAALAVEGAAAPEDAVLDHRPERRVPPLALDRDDVAVRHQDDRPVRSRTGPAEQQPVAADPCRLQTVQERETLTQHAEERVEGRVVPALRVPGGDGGDAEELAQCLDGLGHPSAGAESAVAGAGAGDSAGSVSMNELTENTALPAPGGP
jgi:hypothetical protein